MRQSGRDNGFVLVNALLIVAALAAAALILVERAESGRNRMGLGRQVDQARLYLDGFEALAMTLLDRDTARSASDHRGEDWATARYDVPVDRGRVSGGIEDLQGRFNINWLLVEDFAAARDGIGRLAEAVGVPPARVRAIDAYLSGEGAGIPEAYLRRAVPMVPRGGAVQVVAQLRQVAGLSEPEFRRLSAVVAALPPETPLNVNTASEDVLASVFPENAGGAVRALVSRRKSQPFGSIEELFAFLDETGEVDTERLDGRFLTVESDWFLVESAAGLDQVALRRQTVIRREGPARQARVVFRLGRRE